MDPYLEEFDDLVDDLLNSDIDIFKDELDLLAFQHLFDSIYLDGLKNVENINIDNLAA